ncbi:GNAT family N-acetyltransferase [Methylobacterium frigidaeris]|uniref:Gentamicin 3-N-acetyltransferase n=1 Tax=Methylobacterium frigidaeris TaxID=2038277 RepID=A0AA37H743_9HYPH|nr:GNAT family N-acetyltransferase [Methylobacterium frigidaeris]PIK70666.1 AAC(3)-I family aminoglycoside 3-N-acetyltransferase [Methylobacterium frigidaeris]GJD60154.1 Gentamicin 3-N-acetyltransferase [Methylobacterium frigidaeris]
MSVSVRRLSPTDIPLLRDLNRLFGQAFEDSIGYGSAPPSDAYLADLLAKEHVFVLVALMEGDVAGGLVAYALDKIEQARREVYVYDLAVDAPHRRRGVATALIEHLRATCGATVIFVQADPGDEAAIALYTKLGEREDVHHFDIPVAPRA